jgi:hypothetical protein
MRSFYVESASAHPQTGSGTLRTHTAAVAVRIEAVALERVGVPAAAAPGPMGSVGVLIRDREAVDFRLNGRRAAVLVVAAVEGVLLMLVLQVSW